MRETGAWSVRYWSAYEWLHNNHRKDRARVNHFATSYANANDGIIRPQTFQEYYERWSAGGTDDERVSEG